MNLIAAYACSMWATGVFIRKELHQSTVRSQIGNQPRLKIQARHDLLLPGQAVCCMADTFAQDIDALIDFFAGNRPYASVTTSRITLLN